MIISVDIISQPFSDQYMEKIYNISSPWNSTDWTWVKFVNEDFTEWCGEFRGLARDVALSKKYNIILLLTSDYLYKLDVTHGELVEYISQPQYQSISVTPLGDFIVADDYHIYTIETSLNEDKSLSSPIEMDNIRFHDWSNNKLLITCEEFLNWDKHVELELDCETLKISVKRKK